MVKVEGQLIDSETRCVYYQSELDIIAIKFKCCNAYFPCFNCHSELAKHEAQVWPRNEFNTLAVLCGVCKTNFVYLSKQLANRQHFFEGLTGVFNKHKIQFSLLPETKDIWCIDYMPIQKQLDEFIQFKYEPDYLQKDQFISNQTSPNLVCESIGIESHKSVIKIDSGNLIKGKDWVILTDKIFSENKG